MEEALKLLENVTPLKNDCGKLCGAACCFDESDAGGQVWLFPAEELIAHEWAETLHSKMPVTGKEVLSIRCRSMCSRSLRPFLCRIFPLVPFYSHKRGEWDVRMDRRAWMLCPLAGSGIRGLNPDFINAARESVRLLSEDEESEAFMKCVSEEENAYRMKL